MATYSNADYNGSNYADFRPTYPDSFFQYLAAWAPNTKLAVDVGCGPGTASSQLAKYVADKVVGLDPSSTMIENATKSNALDNLMFKQGHDTDLTKLFEPESIDLITVAEAAHWFTYPDFLDQVATVLKKDGKLVIWGYIDPYAEGYPQLREALEFMTYDKTCFGSNWDTGRQLLTDYYRDIRFPPSLVVERRQELKGNSPDYLEQPLQVKRRITSAQFISFLRTYSSYHNWKKANVGTTDIIDEFQQKMLGWGIQPGQMLDLQWDTILILVNKQ